MRLLEGQKAANCQSGPLMQSKHPVYNPLEREEISAAATRDSLIVIHTEKLCLVSSQIHSRVKATKQKTSFLQSSPSVSVSSCFLKLKGFISHNEEFWWSFFSPFCWNHNFQAKFYHPAANISKACSDFSGIGKGRPSIPPTPVLHFSKQAGYSQRIRQPDTVHSPDNKCSPARSFVYLSRNRQ